MGADRLLQSMTSAYIAGSGSSKELPALLYSYNGLYSIYIYIYIYINHYTQNHNADIDQAMGQTNPVFSIFKTKFGGSKCIMAANGLPILNPFRP